MGTPLNREQTGRCSNVWSTPFVNNFISLHTFGKAQGVGLGFPDSRDPQKKTCLGGSKAPKDAAKDGENAAGMGVMIWADQAISSV